MILDEYIMHDIYKIYFTLHVLNELKEIYIKRYYKKVVMKNLFLRTIRLKKWIDHIIYNDEQNERYHFYISKKGRCWTVDIY